MAVTNEPERRNKNMDIFTEGELRDMRASFQPAQWPSGSSAQAPVESRGASQLVGSDASGSVSAYDALCLAVSWEKAADEREKLATEARRAGNIDEALPLENSAAAYMRCARELTKLTGYPNMRQPTQNVASETRRTGLPPSP